MQTGTQNKKFVDTMILVPTIDLGASRMDITKL